MAWRWHRRSNSWYYTPSTEEVKSLRPSAERIDELCRLHHGSRALVARNEATRLWRIALREGRVQAPPRPDGRPALLDTEPRKRKRASSPRREATPPPEEEVAVDPLPEPSTPSTTKEPPPAAPPIVSTQPPPSISESELLFVPPLHADKVFPELYDRRVRIREAAHFENWVWGGPDAFLNAVPFIAGMLALMEEEEKLKLSESTSEQVTAPREE